MRSSFASAPFRRLYLLSTLAVLACAVYSAEGSAATSERCPGEVGYYYTNYRRTSNPTAGGFVANTVNIRDTDSYSIVIQPQAAVCGYAILSDSVSIAGNAIVKGDAQVSGNAIITGSVVLDGDVVVEGKSIIRGNGTLKTGRFNGVQITLNDSPPATSKPKRSAIDIATALEKYVSDNARNFSPKSGNLYDGSIRIDQAIEFSNGPCELRIRKKRYSYKSDEHSSFLGRSVVSFNIGRARKILLWSYSPHLSTASIQMDDYKRYAQHQVWDQNGHQFESWVNREVLYNSSTVESIEAPTKAHAETIQQLLTDLMEVCHGH